MDKVDFIVLVILLLVIPAFLFFAFYYEHQKDLEWKAKMAKPIPYHYLNQEEAEKYLGYTDCDGSCNPPVGEAMVRLTMKVKKMEERLDIL